MQMFPGAVGDQRSPLEANLPAPFANMQTRAGSKLNGASSQPFRSPRTWASRANYRQWEHLLRIVQLKNLRLAIGAANNAKVRQLKAL